MRPQRSWRDDPKRVQIALDACTPAQIAALDESEAQAHAEQPDMAELTAARLDDIRLFLGIVIVLLGLLLWRVW